MKFKINRDNWDGRTGDVDTTEVGWEDADFEILDSKEIFDKLNHLIFVKKFINNQIERIIAESAISGKARSKALDKFYKERYNNAV